MTEPSASQPVEQTRDPLRIFWWLLRFAIGITIIWFVARGRTDELVEVYRSARPTWLIAAVLAFLGVLIVSAARWDSYLRATQTGSFPPMRILRLTFVGTFFNAFLPTGVGGDAYKTMRIVGRGERARAAASVLLDRYSGLVGLAVVGFIAMAADLDAMPKRLLLIAEAVSVAIIVTTVVPRASREWVLRRAHIPREGRLGGAMWRAVGAVATANRSLFVAGRGYLWGVASQAGILLVHVFIARGLGLDLGIGVLASAAVVAQLVALLPISINGLGLREATYVWALGLAGLDPEPALAFAVGMLGVLVIGSLAGGLVFVFGGPLTDLEGLSRGESQARASR
ncbi:MAG: lysylphosphatidylglycerol synthase transmembrane domain-containing protein [Actinomycetota bacterium]